MKNRIGAVGLAALALSMSGCIIVATNKGRYYSALDDTRIAVQLDAGETAEGAIDGRSPEVRIENDGPGDVYVEIGHEDADGPAITTTLRPGQDVEWEGDDETKIRLRAIDSQPARLWLHVDDVVAIDWPGVIITNQ